MKMQISPALFPKTEIWFGGESLESPLPVCPISSGWYRSSNSWTISQVEREHSSGGSCFMVCFHSTGNYHGNAYLQVLPFYNLPIPMRCPWIRGWTKDRCEKFEGHRAYLVPPPPSCQSTIPRNRALSDGNMHESGTKKPRSHWHTNSDCE